MACHYSNGKVVRHLSFKRTFLVRKKYAYFLVIYCGLIVQMRFGWLLGVWLAFVLVTVLFSVVSYHHNSSLQGEKLYFGSQFEVTVLDSLSPLARQPREQCHNQWVCHYTCINLVMIIPHMHDQRPTIVNHIMLIIGNNYPSFVFCTFYMYEFVCVYAHVCTGMLICV